MCSEDELKAKFLDHIRAEYPNGVYFAGYVIRETKDGPPKVVPLPQDTPVAAGTVERLL